VSRRYAKFATSLLHLTMKNGDGQLDLNVERLRVAVDDLLVKLAGMFKQGKQRPMFLINNYDLVLFVLKVSNWIQPYYPCVLNGSAQARIRNPSAESSSRL